MRGFSHKKAIQALNYLATLSGGAMNKMKAIKLIWLADRLHIRQYGRTITGDVYFALPFGPVPSTTRDILENSTTLSDLEADYAKEYLTSSRYEYRSNKAPDLKVFSQTDRDIIERIYAAFGSEDHFTLSEFSHQFPEWRKYEIALKNRQSSRFSMDTIDFFENVEEKSGLFNESEEHLQPSKELYMDSIDSFSTVL
jgi:hypothetical protein